MRARIRKRPTRLVNIFVFDEILFITFLVETEKLKMVSRCRKTSKALFINEIKKKCHNKKKSVIYRRCEPRFSPPLPFARYMNVFLIENSMVDRNFCSRNHRIMTINTILVLCVELVNLSERENVDGAHVKTRSKELNIFEIKYTCAMDDIQYIYIYILRV